MIVYKGASSLILFFTEAKALAFKVKLINDIKLYIKSILFFLYSNHSPLDS